MHCQVKQHRGTLQHDNGVLESANVRSWATAGTERHTSLSSRASIIIPPHMLITTTCDIYRRHDYATFRTSTVCTSNHAHATSRTAYYGSAT